MVWSARNALEVHRVAERKKAWNGLKSRLSKRNSIVRVGRAITPVIAPKYVVLDVEDEVWNDWLNEQIMNTGKVTTPIRVVGANGQHGAEELPHVRWRDKPQLVANPSELRGCKAVVKLNAFLAKA